MWRIGIAVVGLLWGAVAGGLLVFEVVGTAGPQVREIAVRQTAAVASDVDAAAGVIGGSNPVPLAQGMRDQLRRELFGAVASGRQARRANEAASDAPTLARMRDPGAGATGDIPASMMASLPPAGDNAAVGDGASALAAPVAAPATATAGSKRAPPLRVSPTPARPRSEPARTALAAPQTSAAVAVEPPAGTGTAGDPKVAEAQRLLAILGYARGAADGRPGRQTTAAVLAYEKSAGLPVDGRIDAAMLTRLRRDLRTPATASAPPATAGAARQPASLTDRFLSGMQRLIARDLDSVRAPEQLMQYCRNRADEWIYDRGQNRMRLCGDINGGGRIAYRPLPGDR